jgi:putative ABC transport system permease protein
MKTPWLWSRRVSRLTSRLPPRTVGPALGDLLEEYAERCARTGRAGAEWWLVHEMSSLGRTYAAATLPGRAGRHWWLPGRLDLAQAFRSLKRTPWYAVTVTGVVAVSIALGATVFAIVDGALFKPLPYPDAGRLYSVAIGWSKLPEPLRTFGVLSPAEFHDWTDGLPDVRMTAFRSQGFVTVGLHDYVRSAQVDATFFDVVGIRPLMGEFAPGDFQSAVPVQPAIITHAFWQERFGEDPAVIGRSLVADTGQGIRVTGVLPAEFVFPLPANRQYVPEVLTPLVDRTPPSKGNSLYVLVRLPRSASEQGAAERLTAAAVRYSDAQPTPQLPPGLPERNRILRRPFDRVGLAPIDGALTESLTRKAWTVFAMAAGLLLLACLNVASLAIARVGDRWRELAVRRSLGAASSDIFRILAVENALIVAVGTCVGVGSSYGLLAVTLHLIGGSYLVVLKPPAIDGRVLFFSALCALSCLAAVTIFAARAADRASLRSAIAQGGGTTPRARGRVSIVAVEVAIGLVIAVAGALVAGGLVRVWSEDPGFDTRNLALVSVSTPPTASAAEVEQLVDDVRHMPGVAAAGGTGHAFLEHAFNGSEFDRPPGVAELPFGSGRFPIESVPVTHGYLEAAGLQVHDGRLPTDQEFATGAPVVVVSDTVTTEFWPGRRAIGQTLLNNGRAYTVVGVVADARLMALDLDAQGEIYWPAANMTPRPLIGYLLVRFTGSPALAPVVAEIKRQCPTCWYRSAEMFTDTLAGTIQPRRFSAWLFSTFAIAALLIVGTGMLGVVAMTTTRRTREIGIRMALGATRTGVMRQIVREQLTSVVLGLVIGGGVSAWAVHYVSEYLYKTPLYDPWSWGVAISALLAVSVLGAAVPSRRASRVDPVRALATE